MNLEQMEYIKEIFQTQSITTAAQNLHVSQSAVSQSISLLEKELGVQLFKRSRFGTIPTAEGKNIITKALKIVENIAEIKEEAQIITSSYKSELKIAAVPSIMTLLPKILSQFKKDFPHIKVTIIEMESKKAIEKVKQHTIDLGFITIQKTFEKELDKFFLFNKLNFHTDLNAIVPKYSSLAFQKTLSIYDLLNYPIVLYTSQFMENLINSIQDRYGNINVLFKTSNSEVIKKTVSEGLAISILSSYILVDDPYVKSKHIIPMPLTDLNFVTDLPFGWIVSKKNNNYALAKMFLEYIDFPLLFLSRSNS
ncbi:LysR family transcriptional regulator [Bacillus sp. 1P02SD]|uniref:LysR family transcriptional regulator n=1 Tax=Bacillus sp. 1P02SD TaxID=3132264 RepID=UPI00399F1715